MSKDAKTNITDEQALRQAARNAAETRLRENHQEEFRALVHEEAEKRGVTYHFRMTAAERAAQKLQDILSQFPELRDQVTEQSV